MAITAKNQAWQDLKQHFSRVTDRLETPIDPGILDVVTAMNAVGLYTTASCEGHLDHGSPSPWVDVSSKAAEDLAQQIAWKLYEEKREESETQQMMKQHRHLLLEVECNLVEQLNVFYQHQPFNYDRHLSISRYSNGMPRLENYGTDCQEFRSENERAAKLKEYQDEIQAFGDFLKRQFLGENEPDEELAVVPAAEFLGIERRTLTQNILRKNIKAEKRGRDYFIRRSELERFKNTPRRAGRPSKV